MDLSKLLASIDVYIVIRVAPPVGTPTVYGPFPNREAAFAWAAEHCQKANAYIGKVYHPDEIQQHILVLPDGHNIG
jgi:hypothetical protein